MSYIPALAWSSSLRLSVLTGEPRWREKAAKEMGGWSAADTSDCRAVSPDLSCWQALAFADYAALTRQ